MQKRIGPENPGLSRFLAARMMMLVMCAFYAAGLVLAFLYGFGINPLR
jgi:nucleoside recognition membrane protein YjiH